MTTTTTATRIRYSGDGSTTSFAIPFSFASSSEVKVELILISSGDVTLQSSPGDYSVSGTNVVFTSAPGSAYKVIISLSPTFSQTLNLTEAQAFPAESVESALDSLARQVKSLKDQLDSLTLKFPSNLLDSTTVVDTDIAPGKIFKINSTGDGIELAAVASLNGGANAWGDAVDASIIPDTASAYNIGTAGLPFSNIYVTNLYGTLQTGAQPNITSLSSLTSLVVDSMTFDGTSITSSGALSFVPTGANIVSVGGTAGLKVPVGTTAQRDATQGVVRYNTTDSKLECYNGTTWVQYSAAGGPGAWSDVVDADIIPDTDNTWDLGSGAARFAEIRGVNLWGTLQTAAQTNITSLGTLTALTVDNISIDGNTITASSGNVEVPRIIDNSGITSHILVPRGTTAQRTGTTAGQVRYNTTENKLEFYNGSGWRLVDQIDSAGDMIHLSTQTASNSATIDFTSLMSSTYRYYKVFIHNLLPVTSGTVLYLRVSTDNGSTWKSGASDYYQHVSTIGSGAVGSENQGTDRVQWPATSYPTGSGANDQARCEITILGAHTSTKTEFIMHGGHRGSAAVQYWQETNGMYNATTEVDAIRFLMSSGNISTGTFSLYGIK